jgi:uncharacterized damage-inducible protein DinB
MSDKARIKDVLELLDPPSGFQPWHGGPSLSGVLKGVKAEQALWKPAPERHSIWGLVLHMAYWKYSIIRQLDPDFPKGFERSPVNFPDTGKTEKEWKKDKELLKLKHEQLVEAIRNFSASKLDEHSPSKKEWTFAQLISGIAAHDTYHIGQIQYIKRLYDELNS